MASLGVHSCCIVILVGLVGYIGLVYFLAGIWHNLKVLPNKDLGTLGIPLTFLYFWHAHS